MDFIYFLLFAFFTLWNTLISPLKYLPVIYTDCWKRHHSSFNKAICIFNNFNLPCWKAVSESLFLHSLFSDSLSIFSINMMINEIKIGSDSFLFESYSCGLTAEISTLTRDIQRHHIPFHPVFSTCSPVSIPLRFNIHKKPILFDSLSTVAKLHNTGN